MAKFNFEQYAAIVAAAQKKENSAATKVGFFKIEDGGEALVRFDITSLQDLEFATIHRVKRNAEDKFCSMSISCLNPLDKTGLCPLCEAAENGDERVQKASKRVYVRMLVAYPNTDPKQPGTWLAPVTVIWERPAGFYKELAQLIKLNGVLKDNLFIVSRTGTKKDTTYAVNYARPEVFKPDLIPADFSAFENFEISKHSYWVKTAEDCLAYLATGAFPTAQKSEANQTADTVTTANVTPQPAPAPTPVAAQTPAPAPAEEKKPEPVPAPAAPDPAPTSFGGFSF